MSLSMRLLVAALSLRPKPLASAEAIAAEVAHQQRVNADVTASLRKTHEVHRAVADGMTVLSLVPRQARPRGELLYTHGGAYVHPLVKPHWHIIDRLSRETPLRITVPLYGLAPERDANDAFPTLHRVYDQVAASGLPLVVAGDSAGAAISMAMTMRARDEERPSPSAVLLFSPWTDATMTNPEIAALEPGDPMLGRSGLIWSAQRWAGSRAVDDPWISPLNDSLVGLPPIRVFQGGRDIFLPDAQRFVTKAAAAGTDAQIHVYPDAFHVFVGVPQLPEARSALSRARAVIASVVRMDD